MSKNIDFYQLNSTQWILYEGAPDKYYNIFLIKK